MMDFLACSSVDLGCLPPSLSQCLPVCRSVCVQFGNLSSWAENHTFHTWRSAHCKEPDLHWAVKCPQSNKGNNLTCDTCIPNIARAYTVFRFTFTICTNVNNNNNNKAMSIIIFLWNQSKANCKETWTCSPKCMLGIIYILYIRTTSCLAKE